jgi:DNA-binding CsgD family transcriptional regulator
LRPAGFKQWSGVQLSPREREVLGLVAEGYGNREIAARLGVSAATTLVPVTFRQTAAPSGDE